MQYFISDLHIGHNNVLHFDNRPFSTIEEHDQYIMDVWNTVVSDEDDVYILGDISWVGRTHTANYYRELKGRKHLIVGNHDKKLISYKPLADCFVSIDDYLEIPYEDDRCIVLSHYPIFSYKNLYRGWIHLYGHVHNSFEWGMFEHHKRMMKELYSKKDDRLPNDIFEAYNVGCMMPYMKYIPKTVEEIMLGYKMNEMMGQLIPMKPASVNKTETEIIENK